MVCISEFYKAKVLPKKMMLGLAQLLAPICPHLAQECYTLLGYDGLIDYVPWPSFDENKMNDRPVTYAIQVNGKLRSTIEWKKDCSEEEAEELKKKALSDEKVLPHIQGKTIAKVIVVKNKIVSIVAK